MIISAWHLVLNNRDLNYFRRPFSPDNSFYKADTDANWRYLQEKRQQEHFKWKEKYATYKKEPAAAMDGNNHFAARK